MLLAVLLASPRFGLFLEARFELLRGMLEGGSWLRSFGVEVGRFRAGEDEVVARFIGV